MLTPYILCEAWNVASSLEGSALFLSCGTYLFSDFTGAHLKNTFVSSGSHSFIGYLNTNFDLPGLLEIFLFLLPFLDCVFHAEQRPFILIVVKCFALYVRETSLHLRSTQLVGPSGRELLLSPEFCIPQLKPHHCCGGSALLQSLESALFLSRDF